MDAFNFLVYLVAVGWSICLIVVLYILIFDKKKS